MNDELLDKTFLFKYVKIIIIKNSVYTGILKRWRNGKILLTDLVICHKDGSFKVVSGSKNCNKRIFNCSSVKSIELYQ